MIKPLPYIIAGGILALLPMVACSDDPDVNKAREVATEALYLMVDNPESVEIINYSDLDSVFGNNFITEDEKLQVAQILMQTNKRIIGDAKTIDEVDFSEAARSALMDRQIEATDRLRPLLFKDNRSQSCFNGWKLKVEYEALDADNQPYHAEYWFILDPKTNHVLHSFEIPLL